MRATPLGLVGYLMVMPVQATEVADWLDRLVQANEQRSFTGTFVYERSGSFSTHNIWRRVTEPGRVEERVMQLDGRHQEAVSIDGVVQCAAGALADQAAEDQVLGLRRFDLDKLATGYQARVAGYSRIAGRHTVVLVFSPRDAHRHGLELHLDEQTGLALKSLLVDRNGRVLERMQYTELRPQSASAVPVSPSAHCREVKADLRATAGAPSWQVGWVPAGFALVASRVLTDPESGRQQDCLVFDDGLTRFSVFIEPNEGGGAFDYRRQFGPTAVASQGLSKEQTSYRATLVGEVPLATAEQVVRSLKPVQSAG